MEISPAPSDLQQEYSEIFTSGALSFLHELISIFRDRTDEILRLRKLRKLGLDSTGELPNFQRNSLAEISNSEWKVNPLPPRLINRHLDLGDVTPSNSEHFKSALNAPVQGIQVDFDDGCCPSWRNIIIGIHNVVAFTRGKFFPEQVPGIQSAPILMLRPRAWNMNEHNIIINGREVPGPLVDFGLLIFHTGKTLTSVGAGPFFYLSKVEGSVEAVLWNDIFVWTQNKLQIPRGTIKACVLIENILASFEMEGILYALREHSLGLNCGIWDYAASFVNKFGTRKEFLLPDRNKYVNMEKHFLDSYMKLVVQTCHRRNAMATGGMAAFTLESATSESSRMEIVEKVCKAKLREIHSGVDGFMVYDTKLVPWIVELWQRFGSTEGPNQISSVLHKNLRITANDLLQMPSGGVTFAGLLKNIKVGISFINSWLVDGRGHFLLDGAVEDSATAEISRSQIWQWIYHQARLEDGTREIITKTLVTQLTRQVQEELVVEMTLDKNPEIVDTLSNSSQIFLEIVTANEFPEFITTYLYNHYLFRKLQNT